MIVRLVVVFTLGIAAVVGLFAFLSNEDHEKAVDTVAALEWVEAPNSYESERLPGDRVAIGRIENISSERIEADAEDFDVRDTAGRELLATLQFIDASADAPADDGEEGLKIGVDLELAPGASSPLTVRYRLDRRAVPPASVYFKEVPALELPTEAGSGPVP